MYKVHPQADIKAWLKFKMINAGFKTRIKTKISSKCLIADTDFMGSVYFAYRVNKYYYNFFCYKLSPTILYFKTSLELFSFLIRKHTLRFNFHITKGWN